MEQGRMQTKCSAQYDIAEIIHCILLNMDVLKKEELYSNHC